MTEPTKTDTVQPQPPRRINPMAGPGRDPGVVPPIAEGQVAPAEYNIIHFRAYVPAGVAPEALLRREYWTHLGMRFSAALQQGAEVIIHAFAEDSTWYATYLVRDAGSNWAKVALVRKTELEAVEPEQATVILPGHDVVYGGRRVRWRVIRTADGKVLRENCATRQDAYDWLREYAKAQAA